MRVEIITHSWCCGYARSMYPKNWKRALDFPLLIHKDNWLFVQGKSVSANPLAVRTEGRTKSQITWDVTRTIYYRDGFRWTYIIQTSYRLFHLGWRSNDNSISSAYHKQFFPYRCLFLSVYLKYLRQHNSFIFSILRTSYSPPLSVTYVCTLCRDQSLVKVVFILLKARCNWKTLEIGTYQFKFKNFKCILNESPFLFY